jgi:hypothetical protein
MLERVDYTQEFENSQMLKEFRVEESDEQHPENEEASRKAEHDFEESDSIN